MPEIQTGPATRDDDIRGVVQVVPTVVQTWLTGSGSELMAHVHEPAGGQSRGAVVLVEGLGRDQATARRAQLVLASRLAEAGFTAVRWHLSGLIDSADPDPADERLLVDRWADDVAAVLQRTHELVPGDLRVAGLRVGGLLAVRGAERAGLPIARAVVWEPVGSARTWLRASEALHKVSAEFLARGGDVPAPEGCTETAGLLFSAADAKGLRGLTLPPAPPAVMPNGIDLVLREDPIVDRALSTAQASDGYRSHTGTGLPALLDIASTDAIVPMETIGRLVDLLTADAGPLQPANPWPVRTEAVVRTGPDGQVRERIVVAAGFHGIETIVPDAAACSIAIAGSTEASDGPTGLWTRLARELAGQRVAMLRCDRTDVGEHADPTVDHDTWPYASPAAADLTAVTEWYRDRTGLIPVLIGLCSGAWIAQQVSARTRVDHIVGVNHVAWSNGSHTTELVDPMADPNVAALPVEGAAPRIARLKDRFNQIVKRWVPYPIFLRLAAAGKVEAPGPWLAPLAAQGTAFHLVLCEVDSRYWRRQRGNNTFDAIRRQGGFISIDRDEGLDHSLFAWSSREATVRIVRRILDDIVTSAARV